MFKTRSLFYGRAKYVYLSLCVGYWQKEKGKGIRAQSVFWWRWLWPANDKRRRNKKGQKHESSEWFQTKYNKSAECSGSIVKLNQSSCACMDVASKWTWGDEGCLYFYPAISRTHFPRMTSQPGSFQGIGFEDWRRGLAHRNNRDLAHLGVNASRWRKQSSKKLGNSGL